MACKFDGGVVMGADSRVSTGTYIANRVSDKVAYLHDTIYMCRSGSAADTQTVSDYLRYYLSSHAMEIGRPPSVKTAANLCQRICYNNKDNLMAGIIIAGWDPVHGGSVYTVPLGGTCLEAPFAIGGSGSTYIYGHVDASYKAGMSKADCQTFVRNGALPAPPLDPLASRSHTRPRPRLRESPRAPRPTQRSRTPCPATARRAASSGSARSTARASSASTSRATSSRSRPRATASDPSRGLNPGDGPPSFRAHVTKEPVPEAG